MTVEWNGEALNAAMREAVMRGMAQGAELVRNEAIRLIQDTPKTGRIYQRRGVAHRASAPGEPPASDTGRLVNSITTSLNDADLTFGISFGTEYALMLEYGTARMQPRPYARPALENTRDAVNEAIQAEVDKVG